MLTTWKPPGQDNSCDCGVFVLHYIETFCRNPPKEKWEELNDDKAFVLRKG